MFKVGDHLRNGGLRNTKLLRRLSHASMLNNRHKYMQIAELKPAANLTFPIDFLEHRELPIWIKLNREFTLYQRRRSIAIKPRIEVDHHHVNRGTYPPLASPLFCGPQRHFGRVKCNFLDVDLCTWQRVLPRCFPLFC